MPRITMKLVKAIHEAAIHEHCVEHGVSETEALVSLGCLNLGGQVFL